MQIQITVKRCLHYSTETIFRVDIGDIDGVFAFTFFLTEDELTELNSKFIQLVERKLDEFAVEIEA